MGAIRVESYKAVAEFYAGAQDRILGISEYYLHAAEEVLSIPEFDPALDLLSPFYNAYLAAKQLYDNPPAAIVGSVRALQRHVLARARTNGGSFFTNINDWIDAGDINGELAGGTGTGSAAVGREDDVDHSFVVPQSFAVLSERAGYPIDPLNRGELGLLVSQGELTSSGPQGGPFAPGSKVYVLTNADSSTISWSAQVDQTWLTLSSTSGTLGPGESTTVTVSINANANALAGE